MAVDSLLRLPESSRASSARVLLVCRSAVLGEAFAVAVTRANAAAVAVVRCEPEEAAATYRRAPAEARYDVVLIDAADDTAVGAARALRACDYAIRILPFDVDNEECTVLAWARAGACGCIVRGASLGEVVEATMGVAAGEFALSPIVGEQLFRHARGAVRIRPTVLTPREVEIASLVIDGLSNKQIAALLHVERSTVKNHIQNIFKKLSIHRRTDIPAALAASAGPSDESSAAA